MKKEAMENLSSKVTTNSLEQKPEEPKQIRKSIFRRNKQNRRFYE